MANQKNMQTLAMLEANLSSLTQISDKHKPHVPHLNIEKQTAQAFPKQLTDTDQTAQQLDFFVKLMKYNNILFEDPRLKLYVNKLTQSPERYNLFCRAVNLQLSDSFDFYINQRIVKYINPELSPSINQTLQQQSVRLFIAADIPIDFSKVKYYVKKHIDSNIAPNVFFEEKQQHLTLLFLGNIQSKELINIFSWISSIISVLMGNSQIQNVTGLTGFYMTIHNGLFGLNKKVIVFDLKDINQSGITLLTTLHTMLKMKLSSYIVSPILNFVPHITLGTIKMESLNHLQQNSLLAFINTINPPTGARGPRHIPSETFNIKSITLYQSSQSGKHIPLARWHLI